MNLRHDTYHSLKEIGLINDLINIMTAQFNAMQLDGCYHCITRSESGSEAVYVFLNNDGIDTHMPFTFSVPSLVAYSFLNPQTRIPEFLALSSRSTKSNLELSVFCAAIDAASGVVDFSGQRGSEIFTKTLNLQATLTCWDESSKSMLQQVLLDIGILEAGESEPRI